MQEPAPKGTIHLVDQNTTKFHEDVARHVGQMTDQATIPQSVNPDDQSPLIKIQQALGDTTHVVGSSFEELVGGTSPDTHDRTIRGHNVVSLIKERAGRLFRRRKAA